MDPTSTPRAPGAPRPTPSRPTATLAGLVLVAALVLVACGGSASTTPAPPTTRTPPSSSTTAPTTTTTLDAPTPEAEVEAVYRAFWDATITANDPPDPGSPVLAASMADPMLGHVISQVTNRLQTGQAIRLPEGSVSSVSDVVVEVSGDQARITACVIDDAVVFDRASGGVLNDRITSGRTEATIKLTSDGWRVVGNRYISQAEGLDGCAL